MSNLKRKAAVDLRCANCGLLIAKGARFCNGCGALLASVKEILDGIKKDIRERRLDEAAKKLDAARKSIDDDNFFSIRGDIDFLSGDFASAEKNYLSITAEKRPWCAALNLGLIAIQTGRPKEAAAYLASVKPTRKNIGDSPVYGEKYRDIKSLNVDVALYLGVINKSEGRMREAAEFFEKAGRLGAPAGIINANLGDIYFKQDNYDKAISFYEAAIRESDDHLQKSSLYNDLGLAYFRKGLSQEAIESLKQALILNPENKNAVYNLGVIYVKSGFQEKIKDDYKEFLKRDDGVEIVYNLTRSMMDAAKKEADKVESIDFIGEDASIKKVKAMLVKAAETDSTVFIQGENGTGKELAARAIHKLSRRNEGPFVVVNCAALPETLLESELFGYEKGAFTGAVKDRTGRFESADGGTVFLDEIGDITPAMQVKLLRFVQNREFERIGGNKTRKADVRIITATNRDIKKLVSEGLFREDLFYRLYVLPVIMPPLRERGSDIIQLARHFLNYFAMKYKKPFKDFEKDALSAMMGCSWPGNVRQLENMIERIVMLYDGPKVRLEWLPEEVRVDMRQAGKAEGSSEYERQKVLRALQDAKYRKGEAAKALGISRVALWKKLKKLGLEK